VSSGCNFEGCTVGETGVCALEQDPATCEHRTALAADPGGGDADADGDGGAGGIGAPVLQRPAGSASFPSSHTLGPEVISGMMASRYVTVVGILGDPDSGKTACLASIYLLVSNAMLEGWAFADSRSLMGFEDIARGARDWNAGNPPDQMTVHTEMSDDRRPGFLHLRLVRKSDGRRVDLALPDLPGEWTTKLVASAQSDRLEFMKAAEAIWVVLDGRVLADKERRQALISRVGQLAERLKTLFDARPPRVVVVVTHRDDGELVDAASSRLAAELDRRGVEASILQVAPFSDHAEVKAGFGIADLIGETVGVTRPIPDFWPTSPLRDGVRSFVGYRRDR
jgi:Double-GTPase 2